LLNTWSPSMQERFSDEIGKAFDFGIQTALHLTGDVGDVANLGNIFNNGVHTSYIDRLKAAWTSIRADLVVHSFVKELPH
jgi:hypothetical protein